MKNNTLKSLIAFSIICCLFISCNAPRTNPLDPENPDNSIRSITGNVKTVKLPRQPIRGVRVLWSKDNILNYTDSSGYFSFNNITKSDGWLYFEKYGYSYDSVYISWQNNKETYVEKFLNAYPQLDSVTFYSVALNKWPNNQTYSVSIYLGISDDENDIDSVFIENSELASRNSLKYNIETQLYEKNLDIVDLKLSSIDDIIGKQFNIVVYDISSRRFNISEANIKRIIKQDILLDAPANRDTIATDKFLLKWKRFTPGFVYNYLAQIYTDEIPAELVWEREIPAENIDFEVNSRLSPGEYFWVMWGIDEFNNRCRSKPASFLVTLP